MNEEKVLTTELVKELGLDKLEVITSDILEGYTRIGYEAFYGCLSLTSIALPNSVTSIGDYAFEDCSSLTSIIIPNSVTSIGFGSFWSCSAVTSITIPDSVTIIGDSAFEKCSSLTSITIPNSVMSIKHETFSGCSSLTSITIHNSVKSIGEEAFKNCSALISVTIGNSITSICWNAFYGCHKLNSIVICDKTYEIQEVVEGKCKAYKAFKGDMSCRGFQYEEGKTYEIDGEPELCKHGFHACLKLTDVFNYYCGKIGKNIVVHEVELENVSEARNENDSKVVAKKITICKRIL